MPSSSSAPAASRERPTAAEWPRGGSELHLREWSSATTVAPKTAHGGSGYRDRNRAGSRELNLQRLKWILICALAAIFGFVLFASYTLDPFLESRNGRLLLDLVMLVGALFLLGVAFEIVSRMHRHLERQNRELITLHRAALDISGELSLDTVLQKVVEQAAQLLEARYGAIAVYDEKRQIRQFLTAGLAESDRDRIGPPPIGRGLLGVVLEKGQRLRLGNMQKDERAAGFPAYHPEMRSLLAVPIVSNSPLVGNLYVAEKQGAAEFTEADEATLSRFATAAAIAIDNAHLHQQLRALAVAEERVRIAREMHDGMAQVLAYVNTKAQAVKEFLVKGRTDDAGRQLEQLAEAAREVYVDVREQILGLRTRLGPGHPLTEAIERFVERWQEQSGIPAQLDLDDAVRLPPITELQLLRIVQEALSNVRKHSRASRARVRLSSADGQLVATVEDDGLGFDPAAKFAGNFPRFGLAIMRERAQSIGGDLELDSQPGAGTRVRVHVPLGRHPS